MKNTLLTALTLGLMSGSAMAHEQQYDNTKEPSESAHKAEPPTGGHSSLASAATNPIANLVQFQIQDAYTPSNNNADGSSNTFIIQPVIPIKLSWEAVPLLLTRTTLPYINTPTSAESPSLASSRSTCLARSITTVKITMTRSRPSGHTRLI